MNTTKRFFSCVPHTDGAMLQAIGAAAAEIIDPSRVALNPDCGFAPDFGEPPSIDEAYEKLSCLAQARTA